jgi:hypothetical protein
MIKLDHKAFFWQEFDKNKKPINPKECQIVFTPNDGGTISYLLDIDEEVNYETIQDKKIELLYAHTSQGEPCTLFNLKFKNLLLKSSLDFEIKEVEYSIEYIFYGTWMDNNELLSHLLVRYSHLEGWFNLIEKQHRLNPKKDIFIVENIVVHNANREESVEDDKVGFWIQNSWNTGLIANGGEITYQLKNHLLMGQYKKFTFKESIELVEKVRSFFEIIAFYSHKNIFIEEFIIQQEQTQLAFTKPINIQILFRQEDYKKEEKINVEYLFQYKDIKESFIEILNRWIENYDKNINEFTAFLNVITDKNSKVNVYSHLFQLMSSLEAYHRRNYIIDEHKQLEHEKYINSLSKQLMTSGIEKKDIERILQPIRYGNQPNFRIRLKEMIEISDIKSILPLTSKIYKSLNNYIYELRNTIAHSKDIVLVDERVENSLAFLKLVVLLVMVKDISLNKLDMSNCRSKMNIDSLDKKLRDSFGGSKL